MLRMCIEENIILSHPAFIGADFFLRFIQFEGFQNSKYWVRNSPQIFRKMSYIMYGTLNCGSEFPTQDNLLLK